MATYIITGSYSVEAIRGMVAKPSDRAAATGALVKAAGGKMKDYYLTTGDHDFLMIVETDDTEGMLASLIAAGASGSVTALKTVQAFSSKEFTAAQTKAAALVKSYKPPH